MTYIENPIISHEDGDLGINEAITHLLSVSKINIGEILNPIGNISIRKISLLIGNLENSTDEIVKNAAQEVEKILELPLFLELKNCKSLKICLRIISEHESVRFNSFLLNILFRNCKKIDECFGVIEKFWHGREIDIFNLNTIFSKCKSLSECEKVISKYATGIEFNTYSYIILLGVLSKDSTTELELLKACIRDILIGLNHLGPLPKNDETTLSYQLLGEKGKQNSYILKVLYEEKLTSLYFLESILKQKRPSPIFQDKKARTRPEVTVSIKKTSPIKNPSPIQPQRKETEYEKRLKEAYSKNLTGSLAHEYAAGKLDTSIGGGGNGSNKKWGNFTGKKDKN